MHANVIGLLIFGDFLLLGLIAYLHLAHDKELYKERVERNNAVNILDRKIKRFADQSSRSLELHIVEGSNILLPGRGKAALLDPKGVADALDQ